MIRQSSPISVRPCAAVPRFSVTHSRIVVRLPTTSGATSPPNFRSCGSPPSTAPDATTHSLPRCTSRSSTTCGPSRVPSPIRQPGPTMLYAPTSTPAPSSALGSISAVGRLTTSFALAIADARHHLGVDSELAVHVPLAAHLAHVPSHGQDLDLEADLVARRDG